VKSEDGAMTVLVSGLIVIVAVLGIAVAAVGMLYVARAQAVNAADAAALAAAVATYPSASSTTPGAAAASAAEANGARLIGCECPIDASLRVRTVEVVAAVRVDIPVFGEVTVKGASRAEFDPMRWLGR
jgi:hypothetical protein